MAWHSVSGAGAKVPPISSSAQATWAKALERYRRVLVLGPTGWFGRTALSLSEGCGVTFHLIGSHSGEISAGNSLHKVHVWDEQTVERFSPDLVLDFAYLTRNWMNTIGLQEYRRKNNELTSRFLHAVSLESVVAGITVSSGASVQMPLDAYGEGKRETEQLAQVLAQHQQVNIGVLRAWSVSGGFVRRPELYALSSFIQQGLATGVITVEADHLVHRRYCAVEELLAVGLHNVLDKRYTLIDSGGEKIEILDLAHKVAGQIPDTVVKLAHANRNFRPSNDYSSDDRVWTDKVGKTGLSVLPIEEQIANVVQALRYKLRSSRQTRFSKEHFHPTIRH